MYKCWYPPQNSKIQYGFAGSSASCLLNTDSPRVQSRFPRPATAFQPCSATWSTPLQIAQPSLSPQPGPPAQFWREAVPSIPTTVLDYGAYSSPLLGGMDWRVDAEPPLSVSYPSFCVLGQILSAGSRYILSPDTTPLAACMAHPTSLHLKGGPRTASGQRGIPSPV